MSLSSVSKPETVKSDAATASDSPITTTVSKTKVEKAHSYLTLVYTSICVLGAVGTAFVWLATTFFLGDVQINPSRNVQGLVVKVIDKRGQSATYFGKDVQLMPGSYHLEIGVIDHPSMQHADVNVQLWKITTVQFAVPATMAQGGESDPDLERAGGNSSSSSSRSNTGSNSDDGSDNPAARKHWWQFWKKAQ